MVKKVLILVISAQFDPYAKMVGTSMETWDEPVVEGVETVYYFGRPLWKNTDKKIYLDVHEDYKTMPTKTIMAFEWALVYRQFDYIARVNASTYVDKKSLSDYVQDLPTEKLFSGLVIEAGKTYKHEWIWGPYFLMSRDVVELLVKNRTMLPHLMMEDMALSELAHKLKIPFTSLKGATIDKMENDWRCVCYGADSFNFYDFSEVAKARQQIFFRCKHDADRNVDAYVMHELHNVFQ